MFLSNRGSFRPETSGAYTLRRRGRRRPKSGSAIGACAVARLAGSGGPIGDYYGSANTALAKARSWLESDHEYTVRFAIGVLLQLFLDERFRPEFFEWVVAVSRPEYYVNMVRAWYFAEALAKQPAAAERVIASGALDEWTHNKAIQKAIESRRIPFEQKGRLRALKRRS